MGSLICQNINIKYGQRVRIMRIENDIYEATDIYLKPTSQVKFPLNEFLGIYAREILCKHYYIYVYILFSIYIFFYKKI